MKKGFTLVEMLAVIVVLSIIMLISIRSISAVRESQLRKIYEEKISNIEKGAVLYAQENPSVFDNNTKCKDTTESTVPGISAYKDYSECIVIKAEVLAQNHYIETEVEDGELILRNNINGFNMLNYYVAIYRNNNRIYAFVSVNEKDNTSVTDRIKTQNKVPQGGAYSFCAEDEMKVLVGEAYYCGRVSSPIRSTTETVNDNTVLSCPTYTQLVDGFEEYCCVDGSVYIDGNCVSTVGATSPSCSAGYELSNNKNLCIFVNTMEDSTCSDPTNYTKQFVYGKYYCVNNSNSDNRVKPVCTGTKELSSDQNYCE